MDMRGSTAVCGVGLKLGSFPDETPLSLAIEAFKLALDDSGLAKHDIDGLVMLSFGADYDRFLQAIGLDVRYVYQGWTHGRFTAQMIHHAALLVASGLANYVAIVHGCAQRPYGQAADTEMWRQGGGPHGESPAHGAVSPAYGAALLTQKYFSTYGGSNEDLAPVAVALRKHARLNPHALRRDPMTIKDHQRSRWVIEPLRLLDCCQNSDGGACIIVTSVERSRDCKKIPIRLLGMQGGGGRPHYDTVLPNDSLARRPDDMTVYEMSGITQKDVDALVVYDAFTSFVLFTLERFGFCGRGEAMEFVKNGRIELGGELPVNTSGGLLSEGHVIGWNLFIEAIRQLRHECGERQVPHAQIIQYAGQRGESIVFGR